MHYSSSIYKHFYIKVITKISQSIAIYFVKQIYVNNLYMLHKSLEEFFTNFYSQIFCIRYSRNESCRVCDTGVLNSKFYWYNAVFFPEQ